MRILSSINLRIRLDSNGTPGLVPCQRRLEGRSNAQECASPNPSPTPSEVDVVVAVRVVAKHPVKRLAGVVGQDRF
jgi:hypothetical protein